MRRLPVHIRSDPTRVLLRPYLPAIEPRDLDLTNASRAERIVTRVLEMERCQVAAELADTVRDFATRHKMLRSILGKRFEEVRNHVPPGTGHIAEERRLLIGAYFSHEYAFEAAALFNPSIVPHPDQGRLAPGEARFVMSLRAVGEGHVSSIVFRSGVVDGAGEVRLDPADHHALEPELAEGAGGNADGLDVVFAPSTKLGERVLFPITHRQRNGIEDARFVRFVEDNGTVAYYATYTAYSGREIVPELLRTDDFRRFRFLPLRGAAVRNKGMALFPRRVDGRCVMLARLDGENLQLATSDDLMIWEQATPLMAPKEPWEFVQIGNCGSPIELPEGWLVLTHGVGPMRRYQIGAVLLDLHEPTRVLARLRMPLIVAGVSERDGYVPNVVYTCGGMMHAGNLVLPFAAADSFATFAVASVRDVLGAML